MLNDTPEFDVLANFIDEAGQSLSTLNSKLLLAESGQQVSELIDEMFRAAHSMKGSAGFLKLTKIQKVTHNLETVLDHLRKNSLEFSASVVDALFMSFDTVSALLAQLATGDDDDIDILPTIAELELVIGITPDNNEQSSNQEEELGLLPDWLKGKLSIDDVMEALIAKNMDQKVYSLRFRFSEIFDKNLDPVVVYHSLESALNIHRVFPIDLPESLWLPLSKFNYEVGLFGWSSDNLFERLCSLDIPDCVLWEISAEQKSLSPLYVTHEHEINTGTPVAVLVVKDDMVKHLSLWLSETSEELDQLDTELLSFEKNNQNPAKHIEVMFRIMHRLKSSCASMGLCEMSRIAHNCESLLDCYRKSGGIPDENVFKALFLSKDVLYECLNRVRMNDSRSPDCANLDLLFSELLAEAGKLESAVGDAWSISSGDIPRVEEILASGGVIYRLRVKLNDAVPLADLRYSMILRNLEKTGEILASVPELSKLDDGIENPESLEVLYSASLSKDELASMINVDQVDECVIDVLASGNKISNTELNVVGKGAEGSPVTGVADTVRVETSRLDQMMNITGELIITKARVGQLAENIVSTLNTIDLRGLDSLINQNILQLELNKNESKLSFSTDRLNRFKDMLLSLQNAQDTAGKLRETSLELHRHTSTLQSNVMQARMVPVGPLFQRFHRLVRDVSKTNGKIAKLVLSGETTELDKKLIDEISDPLTHLIRNSVDHGLEMPEDRVSLGKGETGTVYLDAYHEGGHICIRVRDDGRGLAEDSIKEKAVRMGMLTEQAAAILSREETYNLIFAPGFSTAAQVTNISGRGVGMDIVKSKITELKGKIEVDSDMGHGCSFTIRLPLTLAMIEALLVNIGDVCYAFPLESVREIVDIGDQDIHSIKNKGKVIKLRDKIIALVELDLIIDAQRLTNTGNTKRAVVTKGNGETLAILVDSVVGEEDVVVKALSHEFSSVRGISGASVLGDGRIALILDVPAIYDCSRKNAQLNDNLHGYV